VLGAVEGAGWSEIVLVSLECAIERGVVSVACLTDGAVVYVLVDALPLFLLLHLGMIFLDILVEVGAVAGDTI
jgi:hypothetical protein